MFWGNVQGVGNLLPYARTIPTELKRVKHRFASLVLHPCFCFARAGGCARVAGMNALNEGLDEILLTEAQIHHRLDELAGEILRGCGNRELTVVAILAGSVMFVADLLKRLPIQLRLDFVGVSSYHGTCQPLGEPTVTKALQLDVRGRDVLVVDDILDSGQTLMNVGAMLQRLQPHDLKSCVFLEKNVPHVGNLHADFVAFQIPDKFVVGYGLDYRERYRNLPFVATFKPQIVAAATNPSGGTR